MTTGEFADLVQAMRDAQISFLVTSFIKWLGEEADK